MRCTVACFVFLFLTLNVLAQTPFFRFGPRLSLGKSIFVGFPATSKSGGALQVAVDATWQFKHFFAAETSPAISVYSGHLRLNEHNGYDSQGRPILYAYKDSYSIFAVEFPSILRFGMGSRKVYYTGFFGTGVGFTMGGLHSKKYDDPTYDAEHRFVCHAMKEISDSYYLAVAGASVEFEFRKGVLVMSLRVQQTNAIAAIEGDRFAVRAVTFGASWKHN